MTILISELPCLLLSIYLAEALYAAAGVSSTIENVFAHYNARSEGA
jgi:hypothetical protein